MAAHAPRFSVIIPAYRGARTIRRAASSALAQTLPPHEVIVCIDGSPDNERAALDGLPVTIIEQANGGVNSARNSAVAESSGEWIVLLDQDDEWAEERLEAIAAETHAGDVAIITTDAWVRDDSDDGDDSAQQRYYNRPFPVDQRTEILTWNFVFAGAAVRRSALDSIGGFNEATGSEYDAWIKLILSGWRAVLVPDPLVTYFTSASQKSRDRVWTWRGIVTAYEWAADQPNLSDTERHTAAKSLQVARGRLTTVEARQALVEKHKGRRAKALRAATVREQSMPMRVKFLAAAVAPMMSRRFISA